MDPERLAQEIAAQLQASPRGAYLLLASAIAQLGGELRLDPQAFAAAALSPAPRLEVDGTDGSVVIRIIEP